MNRTNHIYQENSNGKGIFSIEGSEIGDYIVSNEVHSVAWFDCCGSLGKYANLLTEDISERNNIIGTFREILNSGSELNLQNNYKSILKLNEIFPQGKYNISLYDDYNKIHEPELPYKRYLRTNVVYGQVINQKREETKIKEWIEDTIEKENKGWHHSDILNLTCSSFYEGESAYLIATQSRKLIKNTIVKDYILKIKDGLRPIVLVYNAWDVSSDLYSNNYLIDGHHKMQAYKKCGIQPKILEFSEIEVDFKKRPFNYYKLTNMYKWQLKHMFDNLDKNNSEFTNILNDKKHPLHRFVKNGRCEEFWLDGKLKSKGNYINDRPTGVIEYYHRNGLLKSKVLYQEGKQISYLNSWDNEGNLRFEIKPADDVQNGERVSYHQDGSISQITYFKGGEFIDGISSIAYHNNGKLMYESITMKNKVVESRYYDRNGKRTS